MKFKNKRKEEINKIIRNYRQLNADAVKALEQSSVSVANLRDFNFGYLREAFISQCNEELQGLVNESNSNKENEYILDAVSWVSANF